MEQDELVQEQLEKEMLLELKAFMAKWVARFQNEVASLNEEVDSVEEVQTFIKDFGMGHHFNGSCPVCGSPTFNGCLNCEDHL